MGPGGVVMLLVLGQDGAQVSFIQDQSPVEELTAQGADEALADRVHPRRLHGRAHDSGAGGLEDGIEGRGEIRVAVTDQKTEVPEPLADVEGQVAGPLRRPVARRVGGDAARCIRRVPCSTNTSTYSLVSATVSTCRESAAKIPAACACRNCRQARPSRRGAGSMPAARRIS